MVSALSAVQAGSTSLTPAPRRSPDSVQGRTVHSVLPHPTHPPQACPACNNNNNVMMIIIIIIIVIILLLIIIVIIIIITIIILLLLLLLLLLLSSLLLLLLLLLLSSLLQLFFVFRQYDSFIQRIVRCCVVIHSVILRIPPHDHSPGLPHPSVRLLYKDGGLSRRSLTSEKHVRLYCYRL